MWAGVALAVVLCTGVAIALNVIDENLPQRQQEALESIVGLIAVAMVTFMIVCMRRNARRLSGELRTNAAAALAAGSAWAPDRDGVPRRHARGARDGGVPARRVPVLATT